MENNLQTLREYFDKIHIDSGDNSEFVIVDGGTELCVSRRYLESDSMRRYLDMVIVDFIYPYVSINGTETIKLFLADKVVLRTFGLYF